MVARILRWWFCCVMACVLGSAAGATEVVFRVEYVGGLDLDAARMAQVLASPETEVRITYAPVLAVPGWTGRLGICGVSRGSASVCIKKRWKSAHLEGKQIARSADSLQFRVPGWRWFGLMPYRPAGPVRVSLPAFWPGGLPVNMDADVSALSVDARPLVDMHLPVPYGGVASWQRIEKEADDDGLPPWQVAACDPAIGFGETTRPHWRQHRQADAYAEWLRALADSEWWASQIDGVVWTQGEQEGVVWRRVAVQRGGVRLEHVRVDEARLPSSHCPGHTRHEFSWQDGALMSARRQETADLFSEQPGCDAVMPVLEEALWSASRLLRYTHVDQHGQQYREAWRDDRGFANCSAAALGHTGSAAVRTDALQRAAIPWQTPGATP